MEAPHPQSPHFLYSTTSTLFLLLPLTHALCPSPFSLTNPSRPLLLTRSFLLLPPNFLSTTYWTEPSKAKVPQSRHSFGSLTSHSPGIHRSHFCTLGINSHILPLSAYPPFLFLKSISKLLLPISVCLLFIQTATVLVQNNFSGLLRF